MLLSAKPTEMHLKFDNETSFVDMKFMRDFAQAVSHPNLRCENVSNINSLSKKK